MFKILVVEDDAERNRQVCYYPRLNGHEPTGCGMNTEILGHVFDKFCQGDTSHATEGNGPGPALVKRVVYLMGGKLSVASVEGEGSAFGVKLRRAIDG